MQCRSGLRRCRKRIIKLKVRERWPELFRGSKYCGRCRIGEGAREMLFLCEEECGRYVNEKLPIEKRISSANPVRRLDYGLPIEIRIAERF